MYGWRGIDTGYYGSEELEDAPDFLDELKILPVQNEVKNEQLKALRKEAEERLKKVIFWNFCLDEQLSKIIFRNFSFLFTSF